MLEVSKKVIQASYKRPEKKEIIVKRYKKQTNYNSKGQMIVERIAEEINITKKINESKKLLKTEKARELLEQIDRIYTK